MKHQLHIRFALVCAMLLAAVMLATPERAAAQFNYCPCDYFTMVVEDGVFCRFEACIVTPDGNVRCAVFLPGTKTRVPCIPGAQLFFIDCHGNRVLFSPGHGCHLGIGVGPNCCTIDACIEYDANGCPVIRVRPSILDVCPCL